MRICWDNLEKMRYSKRTGMFYNGAGCGYIERESCKNCGETFLSRGDNSDFCSYSCRSSGKHNNMYGKTHSEETKEILRESIKRSQITIRKRYGVENISQLKSTKLKKRQTIINLDTAKEMLKSTDLFVLEVVGENKHSALTLKCKNGHTFTRLWKYLQRGRIKCVECYHDDLRKKGISDIEGFNYYKRVVNRFTKLSWNRYKDQIRGSVEYGRSKEYHLDHKYSKIEGFKNYIPPYIIGHHKNLEILTVSENCSKQGQCSISKEELFDVIFQKK